MRVPPNSQAAIPASLRSYPDTRSRTTAASAFASPINSAVRCATPSAAASNTASALCTYRLVIERPLCPTRAAIVGSE